MKESERSLPVRGLLERRRVVLGSAAALLLAIFVVGEAAPHSAGSIAFLYVVPIALTALELGLLGGLIAAAVSICLLGIWVLTRETELGAVDVILTAGTLIALALVAGRFSDRMRGARSRQQQLLDIGLALARRLRMPELPELAAQRAIELVPARGAKATIEDAGTAELGALDGPLLTLHLGTGASEAGVLQVAEPQARSFTADERMALELLSLQVAAAAENERLHSLERERVALESELGMARGRLAEQEHQLAQVLDTHESERAVLAHELHEQAAQALVAIQLGLGAVERDLGSAPTRGQIEMLRSHLADTLRTLRELAVGLRPPALDQLGLEPALRSLAERTGERLGDQIVLLTEGLDGRLHPRVETNAYRLVDDILATVQGPVTVRVALDRPAGELRIETSGADHTSQPLLADARFARIRVRVELLGGSLTVVDQLPANLLASIPVPQTDASDEALS